MTIQEIEREARAIARRPGAEETEQSAFARLLEANPEAYAAYRAQHNAAPVLQILKAAGGVQIKR